MNYLLLASLTSALIGLVLVKKEIEKIKEENRRRAVKEDKIVETLESMKIEIEEVLESIEQTNKATHKTITNDFKKITKSGLELIKEMKIVSETMDKTVIVDSKKISDELFLDILDNDQYVEELSNKLDEIKKWKLNRAIRKDSKLKTVYERQV